MAEVLLYHWLIYELWPQTEDTPLGDFLRERVDIDEVDFETLTSSLQEVLLVCGGMRVFPKN